MSVLVIKNTILCGPHTAEYNQKKILFQMMIGISADVMYVEIFCRKTALIDI